MKPLKVTKWFKPYKADGKYNFTEDGKGCYLIKKDGKIVYIGKSLSSIKKTMYRHFQQWTDLRSSYGRKFSPYERVTYKGDSGKFLCKVIFSGSSTDIDLLEQVLIKKIKPRDNTLKLEMFTKYQEAETLEKLNTMEEAPF